jgi:hypothetical protein
MSVAGMKRKLLSALVLGIVPISLASPSYAGQWSSVAAGCVPESSSAGRADINAVFGTVSFKSTSTQSLRFTCPVTVPLFQNDDDLRVLNVNYYDRDGAGTRCQVKAFLLRANLDQRERGTTIVGFDSNRGSSITEPGTGRSKGFVAIPERLNSNTNYYWVDLELFRSDTSCNPTAVGVYITREAG